MKPFPWVLIGLLIAILLSGCDRDDESVITEPARQYEQITSDIAEAQAVHEHKLRFQNDADALEQALSKCNGMPEEMADHTAECKAAYAVGGRD